MTQGVIVTRISVQRIDGVQEKGIEETFQIAFAGAATLTLESGKEVSVPVSEVVDWEEMGGSERGAVIALLKMAERLARAKLGLDDG